MVSKLLTFFLILLLSQCDRCKEEVKPVAEIDKLPPATQSGKFTFGCLVNGKAFMQTNSIKMVGIYQGGFIQFGADDIIDGFTEQIHIVIPDPIEINKRYDLAKNTNGKARFIRYSSINNSTCYYDLDNTLSGHVIFTRLDRQKFIVSGKFEFTTSLPGCDTIRITDGRFDMQYIP